MFRWRMKRSASAPPPSSQSYLVIDNIVAACRDNGGEAVHPGYGFFSENAAFAERLGRGGHRVYWPRVSTRSGAWATRSPPSVLRSEAGVNTIPGSTDVIRDADMAVRIAREIGYPVMLKASAGGGGKGMRVARNDDECREGFERATNEASSSFGDERVFIEKFIEQPRHIEIQVLGDRHGNIDLPR